MSPQTPRAGAWFLNSGIQEPYGGVARYYRADLEQNHAVSNEITGYAISALTFLHSVTDDPHYLDRAVDGARFLARTAWDPVSRTMPFELDPAAFSYFFDCGIIVRGLLAVWRATHSEEFLEVATAIGMAMIRDFPTENARGHHPILALPSKQPLECDALRWSRSAGCYQLKAAMAWWDLWEISGDAIFLQHYDRAVAFALEDSVTFLPGHPDRLKVMDRLHAFLYFLEGLLPRAADPHCAAALCTGIRSVARYLTDLASEFERSDVYAQLLRIRLYAAHAGAAPLDRDAAQKEAERLATFQTADAGPRLDGGFCFGRTAAGWLPYINPVSTAFALQALELWESGAEPDRHSLI